MVVSDIGAAVGGDGSNSRAADEVVERIRSAGGTAVADYNSVDNGEKIIETAIQNYGRVDILWVMLPHTHLQTDKTLSLSLSVSLSLSLTHRDTHATGST